MLKFVTPSWGNPTRYSETLYISGKIGRQKEERMKTGIIYSVGLYQRRVVI